MAMPSRQLLAAGQVAVGPMYINRKYIKNSTFLKPSYFSVSNYKYVD
jgi:hypothetical protein